MSFDRERLPDPISYYEEQGLAFKERRGKWRTTSCAFHGGSDSMRINTDSGAFCCMACGERGGDVLAYEMKLTGAEFEQAARALGAWVDDGRPTRPQKPTALPARAALQVLTFEAVLVATAAGNLAHGLALSDVDRQRLAQAAQRINTIAGDFAS